MLKGYLSQFTGLSIGFFEFFCRLPRLEYLDIRDNFLDGMYGYKSFRYKKQMMWEGCLLLLNLCYLNKISIQNLHVACILFVSPYHVSI